MKPLARFRYRKITLEGWKKWVVVLVMPFGALFADARLNTEMVERDYELATINRRLQELRETLDSLRIEEARLETMDRIEIAAPNLGLVKPEPNQIKVIYYVETDAPAADDGARSTLERNLWDTGSQTPRTRPNALVARLHEVIASARSSCLGDS